MCFCVQAVEIMTDDTLRHRQSFFYCGYEQNLGTIQQV